jgi:DNA repair exonuclease SbcCD ATPase subunit
VSQKVFESLNQYLDSVQLGDLSTLSPEAKLAEARRQFDTMAQQAQTGDATAAQGLPQAANALLQASRAFNASSPAFVEDFNRVATVIQAVRDQFGKSLPVDVQTLEAVRRQVATAEQSIEVLQRQKEVIQRTAEEQVALLQKAKDEAAEQSAQLIERLTNQRDAIQEASDKQLAKLEESRQAVLDSAQRQIDQLIADENAKLQTRLRENEFYTQFQQYTLESSTYFANIIEELQAQTGAMNGSFGGSTGTGDTAQSTSPVQVALEANVTELKEANRVLKEELTELRVRLDKLITVSVAASGEEVAATRQVERAVGVLATETRNAAQAAATRIPVRR